MPADANEAIIANLYVGFFHRRPEAAEMAHWTSVLNNGHSLAAVINALVYGNEALARRRSPLYVPPGHFYSPVVDPHAASVYLRTKIESVPAAQSIEEVAIDRTAIVAMWRRLVPLMAQAKFPEEQTPGFRYCLNNPMYGPGDGYMLSAMLQHFKPKRIIEVGSGWSSACTVDTIDLLMKTACRVTFIEPYPQTLLALLGERATSVSIVPRGVQDVPLKVFEELEENDILFIDLTHVLRTGSDVCYELFEILPKLRKGVVVHFHDMFWPFEYPRAWVVEQNRSWNELYAIRAYLMYNRDWEVLMFNDMMLKLERDLIESTFPAFLANAGGALWLRRV